MGLRLTTVITELLIQTRSQPCVCSEGARGETRKMLDIGARRGDGWPVSPTEGEGEGKNENRGCWVYSALEKLVWERKWPPSKDLFTCVCAGSCNESTMSSSAQKAPGQGLYLLFALHQSVHWCIQHGQPHHPSRKRTKTSLTSYRLEHQSATASARSFTLN